MTEQEYNKEIDYIFNRFPSFQKVGAGAYKPGIEGMAALAGVIGNPQDKFRAIHIAGTNGKGSTSHMLAAALASVPFSAVKWCDKERPGKLKVGLYTSPHLVDFRERIKVSGSGGFEMVPKEFVYDFIVKYKSEFEKIGTSFFEITTAMAFAWFAHCGVDVAVIECGLGGRLDSTNIIAPQLSVITNIGLDHCDFLGTTLESIAFEKAGIIKGGVPVVIGEESGVGDLFRQKSSSCDAPIIFAQEYGGTVLKRAGLERDKLDLKGDCQEKNIKTVAASFEKWMELSIDPSYDYNVHEAVEAIHHAAAITGLRGRWERLCPLPYIVCDTGHNSHGFKILGNQIKTCFRNGGFERLTMIFGVVADKDLDSISNYLPKSVSNAQGDECQVCYLFVNAKGTRALPAHKLQEKMMALGFSGKVIYGGNIEGTLDEYLKSAEGSSLETMIFIGGSTFVVAEALAYFDNLNKK